MNQDRAGLLQTVYFKHETRHPNNVLLAWYDMWAVPRVGEQIQGPLGTWEVTRVVWVGAVPSSQVACIDVYVRDAS